MLALEGDNRKADDLYRKLLETDYSKTPDGGQLLVPYLLARKRYAEALGYAKDEKNTAGKCRHIKL